MSHRNYAFLLTQLVLRDFRIRYRNMSLGVFWSLLNPLIMMGVLTLIFTRVLRSGGTPNFHVFVLCGLVPFNFFALGWVSGTVSIFGNAALVKRVLFPREVLPLATVLANCIHFAIQIALLLVLAAAAGYRPTRYWLLLPVVFGLEVIFVCGLALVSSSLDVFFRDVRYVVESANTVLFWLVPIFYSFAVIPVQYHSLYQYNPVAAVVLACRNIILDGKAPPASLMWKLTLVSGLALILGFMVFGHLKRRFSDYL
ncbi:MAG: ABC transporter permease [Bryobacterales bacterium]|nr:ABC transporter permease [Bryobacteraceae bacterium]MDW8353994.1 ABC transporter permease [Bryobacterales bacterium]